MSKRPVIIIDSDAIIAQIDVKDIHHKKVNEISRHLTDINALVFYPATIIAESTAHIQRVLGSSSLAYEVVKLMIEPNTQVIEIGKQTLINAMKFFHPTTSKKNTLFDCIVAALAEEYNADAIFSFDKFYKKNGFKLASELL